ncbi:RusA family crossover junction endodeoxyribonuclease [Anaerohalosphaeraceae bacterium U12dextr]
MKISFFVPGRIAPGGSKTGFYRHGRVIMAPASKFTKSWMQSVRAVAMAAYHGSPIEGAVRLCLSFRVPRPKSHWTKKTTLSKTGRQRPYPIAKPDLTKLIRSTEDALTGILWKDDSQVVRQVTGKDYCTHQERSGVFITVEIYDGQSLHECKK